MDAAELAGGGDGRLDAPDPVGGDAARGRARRRSGLGVWARAATYEFRAAVLTRHAFDHYAQGRTIPERTLTPFAQGLDGRWILNMPHSGQSPPGSAEGTTLDLPALSIADAGLDEGDSGEADLAFTVTLDGAATEDVTVDWATSDGTATAGTDYAAGSGTLTLQRRGRQRDGVRGRAGRRRRRAGRDVHGDAVERIGGDDRAGRCDRDDPERRRAGPAGAVDR